MLQTIKAASMFRGNIKRHGLLIAYEEFSVAACRKKGAVTKALKQDRHGRNSVAILYMKGSIKLV